MDWREKLLCRILLLVARIVDPSWTAEIITLRNHITVALPDNDETEE